MIRLLVLIFVTAFITSCSSTVEPMARATIAQSQQILDQSAQEANNATSPGNYAVKLSQEVSSSLVSAPIIHTKAETFDVVVNDVPVHEFFISLMQHTSENMVVSPDVEGSVTLNLHGVTLADVLEAIKHQYHITYRKVKYGYRIEPIHLETRVFHVSHINISQTSSGVMQIVGASPQLVSNSAGGGGSTSSSSIGQTSSLKTEYNNSLFWSQLKETIARLIDSKQDQQKNTAKTETEGNIEEDEPGSFVTVNVNSSIVVVRAYPDQLEQVAHYLDTIQAVGSKQIIIEAKIIELTLGRDFQTGINWSQAGLTMNSTTGDISISNPVSFTNIDTVVSLLSKQGSLSILSNPRLSVVNNQAALIKIGTDRYFVTGVESSTTPVGTTATITSNVQLEPFFSGIALDVVPNITPDGMIKLHIHPIISYVKEDERTVQLSADQTLLLPLAETNTRETDSTVKIYDGQVIVLGGLMQSVNQIDKSTFAGFEANGSYPNHADKGETTELVILLKASVTDSKVWADSIATAKQSYSQTAMQMG